MFRVTARTVLQLGAELISSDSIAFYELIKNAVDAGSPKAFVQVVVRLPPDALHEATALLHQAHKSKAARAEAVGQAKEGLIRSISPDVPDAEAWAARIADAADAEDL